jgi:hypothetical protein
VKLRYLAALALVVWYVTTPPTPGNRNPWITPTPAESPGLSVRDRELWDAQHKAEVAIEWNLWVYLVPHVKRMNPIFILDKNAPADGPKGVGKTGICVRVDKPDNVRWAERWVPSQLEGVSVAVEADPRWRLRTELRQHPGTHPL